MPRKEIETFGVEVHRSLWLRILLRGKRLAGHQDGTILHLGKVRPKGGSNDESGQVDEVTNILGCSVPWKMEQVGSRVVITRNGKHVHTWLSNSTRLCHNFSRFYETLVTVNSPFSSPWSSRNPAVSNFFFHFVLSYLARITVMRSTL